MPAPPKEAILDGFVERRLPRLSDDPDQQIMTEIRAEMHECSTYIPLRRTAEPFCVLLYDNIMCVYILYYYFRRKCFAAQCCQY
jgi:hypothetical protein